MGSNLLFSSTLTICPRLRSIIFTYPLFLTSTVLDPEKQKPGRSGMSTTISSGPMVPPGMVTCPSSIPISIVPPSSTSEGVEGITGGFVGLKGAAVGSMGASVGVGSTGDSAGLSVSSSLSSSSSSLSSSSSSLSSSSSSLSSLSLSSSSSISMLLLSPSSLSLISLSSASSSSLSSSLSSLSSSSPSSISLSLSSSLSSSLSCRILILLPALAGVTVFSSFACISPCLLPLLRNDTASEEAIRRRRTTLRVMSRNFMAEKRLFPVGENKRNASL
mmetsp:Transcript_12842/g.19904  ORF Transcript_12842/g.19904 Transcript_12842/m.19904 type:complete len:275 (+) Transcript_12842:746-1570(+)